MEAGDEYDTVLAVDISPDRHYIALGGPNRLVKIFKDGKLLFSIKKHTDWVTALAFTSDGKNAHFRRPAGGDERVGGGKRHGTVHAGEPQGGRDLDCLPGTAERHHGK